MGSLSRKVNPADSRLSPQKSPLRFSRSGLILNAYASTSSVRAGVRGRLRLRRLRRVGSRLLRLGRRLVVFG